MYVTYALTFLVIYVLLILFRNSPFSLYFVGWSKQRLAEKAATANELKFREAARYLSGHNKDKSSVFYGPLLQQDAVDLTVAVVTVKRSGGKHSLGYLTQVVAELEKIFKSDVHFKKAMFTCNTFGEPDGGLSAILPCRSTRRFCAVLCIAFSSPSSDRTCTPCSFCPPTSTACPRRLTAARRPFSLTPRRPSRSAATWRRRRATADSRYVAVRAHLGLHHAAGAAERRQTYWVYFDAERHF